MVIDSSALLAILFGGREKRRFNEMIEADAVRMMSAASYLESAIIIDDRLGAEGARDFKLFPGGGRHRDRAGDLGAG